jgi:hypothetical protein
LDKKNLTEKDVSEIKDFEEKYEISQGKNQPYSNILIICPETEHIKSVSKLLAKNKISHGAYFSTIDYDPAYLDEKDQKYLSI